MKKRSSFDELVQANRQQILKDRELMDKIEQNVERRIHQSGKRSTM